MNDLLVDWEHESQKDYIFALERQKDIEASWQKEEQKPKVKIEIHEIFNRNKSFRRVNKRIQFLRSRIPVEANTAKVRHITNVSGQSESGEPSSGTDS